MPTLSHNQSRQLYVKHAFEHELRNVLLMCANHHGLFDGYRFFIRFLPDIRKFVLVNYSDNRFLREFHGRAIALDITDPHVPFPSLFIAHEMRVRGFHPFAPPNPAMPNDIAWQDWILSEGLFNGDSSSFKREPLPCNHNSSVTAHPQLPPTTANIDGTSSGGRTLALNAEVIDDILAATRAMPPWKAFQIEGTSWTGTARENIQTYITSIGVEHR